MSRPTFYRFVSDMISPVIPLWLWLRSLRGKEDFARRKERYGFASTPRPQGTLFWLHAASVGEANSVLLLIGQLQKRHPHIHLLLTTGTRTSAELMQKRLPKQAIHQYIPIDTPDATWRFMRHWRPDFAFLVESELWPNLIYAADSWQCFLGLINARMSERSFAFWQKHSAMAYGMLKCMNLVFAQSDEDAERLKKLGAKQVHSLGNLKYDAAPLPCDEHKLLAMKKTIGERPMWLAASTHPGEESMIAAAHNTLEKKWPNLLTIIVPRHPNRGAKIASEIGRAGQVHLRSHGDSIAAHTSIYIADTLGELGLFYRLSDIVFMGGSLVKHGGQNPLEPARLSCAIITGPHTHNFIDIYQRLETCGGMKRVASTHELIGAVDSLLANTQRTQHMQDSAQAWLANQSGAAEKILDMLRPALEHVRA